MLDRPELEALGMGAFIGVAQGSKEPPKLIVMKYEGDPDNPENNLAIVGKGITFDSGGISIKPSANMGDMKGDMAGGAAVISAMKVIGQVGPKINVTGIVAATENMPGGGAQRPGDIVKTMSGKTIEIDNTDAEGRAGTGRCRVLRALTGNPPDRRHRDADRRDEHRPRKRVQRAIRQ